MARDVCGDCFGEWAGDDGEPDGEPPRPTRPSGVEVVRAELIAASPMSSIQEADALLDRARRLFDARERSLAESFKGSAGAPWSDASAVTVRAWVAVAREAARL